MAEKTAFDNERYIQEQTAEILESVERFRIRSMEARNRLTRLRSSFSTSFSGHHGNRCEDAIELLIFYKDFHRTGKTKRVVNDLGSQIERVPDDLEGSGRSGEV